jgi:hypothetical protein
MAIIANHYQPALFGGDLKSQRHWNDFGGLFLLSEKVLELLIPCIKIHLTHHALSLHLLGI